MNLDIDLNILAAKNCLMYEPAITAAYEQVIDPKDKIFSQGVWKIYSDNRPGFPATPMTVVAKLKHLMLVFYFFNLFWSLLASDPSSTSESSRRTNPDGSPYLLVNNRTDQPSGRRSNGPRLGVLDASR
jgi:hypothetical protein